MSIVLQHVRKTYGHTVAVDDMSLTVEQGECVAFLGPNGAGKTTTIKMIAGLLVPDSGEVHVCGCLMNVDGHAARQQLAYVPDQPFLYEKLTGAEFLKFVAEMYQLDQKQVESDLERYTDLFQIDFLDQLCESYSHGMKQKVVLAAALLHRPRVLVVDEPMVGLDPRMVRVVKDLIREQTQRGGCVFMSTHTLDVAEQVADRIAIIQRGKLLATGTLEQLLQERGEGERLEELFLDLTEGGSEK